MPAVLAPIEGPALSLDRDAFFRLLEDGRFRDARVELIDGDLLFKMPEDFIHADALSLVFEALQGWQEDGLRAYNQAYLEITPRTVPQPDAFLIRRDARRSKTPILAEDAVLVVEVSNVSLRRDRGITAERYARAGISEYWIVNPIAHQVEVRRRPVGREYLDLLVLGEEDEIAPAFALDRVVRVGDLLPDAEPGPLST